MKRENWIQPLGRRKAISADNYGLEKMKERGSTTRVDSLG